MSMATKYAMKKRMAKGGKLEGAGMPEPTDGMNEKCDAHGAAGCEMCHGGMYAKGGEVSNGSGFSDDMVDRIMKHKYSKGGEVANDVGEGESADKKPNQFDDLVLDDDLEFSETGKNSGDEDGDDQEDEDREDVVSRAMKSRKKKDKMPRPA